MVACTSFFVQSIVLQTPAALSKADNILYSLFAITPLELWLHLAVPSTIAGKRIQLTPTPTQHDIVAHAG